MQHRLALLALTTLLAWPVVADADSATTGASVGALGGALAGSLAGPAKNRVDNTLLGAVAGGLLGYAVGNEAEKQGHAVVHHALESAPPNTTLSWVNPANGVTYLVIPQPAYKSHGRPCRKVTIQAIVPDRKEILTGSACRNKRGWRLVKHTTVVVVPTPPPVVVASPPPPAVVVLPVPTIIYEERGPYRHHHRYW